MGVVEIVVEIFLEFERVERELRKRRRRLSLRIFCIGKLLIFFG